MQEKQKWRARTWTPVLGVGRQQSFVLGTTLFTPMCYSYVKVRLQKHKREEPGLIPQTLALGDDILSRLLTIFLPSDVRLITKLGWDLANARQTERNQPRFKPWSSGGGNHCYKTLSAFLNTRPEENQRDRPLPLLPFPVSSLRTDLINARQTEQKSKGSKPWPPAEGRAVIPAQNPNMESLAAGHIGRTTYLFIHLFIYKSNWRTCSPNCFILEAFIHFCATMHTISGTFLVKKLYQRETVIKLYHVYHKKTVSSKKAVWLISAYESSGLVSNSNHVPRPAHSLSLLLAISHWQIAISSPQGSIN